MDKNTKLLTELREMKNLMNYIEGDQIINEGDNPRAQLHTLVGDEMKSEKRARSGGPHHVEAHKKAKQATEIFLNQHPEMREFVADVEDHFLKKLYR